MTAGAVLLLSGVVLALSFVGALWSFFRLKFWLQGEILRMSSNHQAKVESLELEEVAR